MCFNDFYYNLLFYNDINRFQLFIIKEKNLILNECPICFETFIYKNSFDKGKKTTSCSFPLHLLYKNKWRHIIYSNIIMTKCGHIFHLHCIRKWKYFKKNQVRHDCPMCRTQNV